VATSQGYFPKWQHPSCAIFRAATSVMAAALGTVVCSSRSAQPILATALGPLQLQKFKKA